MPLRLCSILGTLLFALCLAQPAFAQDTSENAASTADDAADGKSARAKKKSRKKAGDDGEQAKRTKRKGKDDAEDDDAEDEKKKADGEAEAATADEPMPDPDAWERPPGEEEKPPAPPPAKEVEETVGDGKPLSVGLLAGYGFKTDRRASNYAGDPYTWAAGIRGGYAFDFQLYLGVYFIYYLGTNTTGDSATVADPTVTTSANYMHFGVEAGYDWWVGPVIVRPSLQLGPALAFTDNPSSAAQTIGDLMFGPGITVVHPMDDFFLGGDLRANIVTGDGISDVLLAATGGLRF